METPDRQATSHFPPPERGIFCNRTLNLRSISAIGYDMDYTLIHYHEEKWEQRAYEHMRQHFLARDWPVEELRFAPEMMARGLVLDTDKGNILECNRFGYIKQACHGTRRMEFRVVRDAYARVMVDLAESRYVFLNTLFSLSEGCMYAQLVDLLDSRQLPEVLGYGDLYGEVQRSLSAAHIEGELKAEIMASPESFVVLDPDTPLALLDQKQAHKRLLLITNSDWAYTRAMMTYAFDPYLPDSMSWQELFDVLIVAARKPAFFTGRNPLYEVVSDDGLLRPVVGGLRDGVVYFGGNAGQVEQFLGLSGDQILYVGDHVWGDVHVSKSMLRWRTALILRELEHEIRSIDGFAADQRRIAQLMSEKERLEQEQCLLRLEQLREKRGYGPAPHLAAGDRARRLQEIREELTSLDEHIGPLARASAEVASPWWGPLMRAGNDKSMLARQVERSADIYTSRVSNFLYRSPFAYLRSPRGSMPHDPGR